MSCPLQSRSLEHCGDPTPRFPAGQKSISREETLLDISAERPPRLASLPSVRCLPPRGTRRKLQRRLVVWKRTLVCARNRRRVPHSAIQNPIPPCPAGDESFTARYRYYSRSSTYLRCLRWELWRCQEYKLRPLAFSSPSPEKRRSMRTEDKIGQHYSEPRRHPARKGIISGELMG